MNQLRLRWISIVLGTLLVIGLAIGSNFWALNSMLVAKSQLVQENALLLNTASVFENQAGDQAQIVSMPIDGSRDNINVQVMFIPKGGQSDQYSEEVCPENCSTTFRLVNGHLKGLDVVNRRGSAVVRYSSDWQIVSAN